MGSDNTTQDFRPGDKVLYIPTHLQFKDIEESDVKPGGAERGIVKRVTDTTVFVNYFRHGVQQETAEGTNPKDLWID